MKLFGLDSSRSGAASLAASLGVALAGHEERGFEDGEFKIRPLESVSGQCAVVYQSLAGDRAVSANDKLMRALMFAGALKDAGAAEVTLVAPYLAYARKDRRTKPRDPVSLRYLAQMVEAAGVDEVVVADVHNPAAFENAFRCRTRLVEAAETFVEHFRTLLPADARVAVVSPDAGGVKRARRFADLLADGTGRAVEFAFIEKYRSEGVVSGDLFAGDVHDAIAIVVDDIISGGTTMRRAAAQCLARGARRVHAVATHGLFADAAAGVLGDGSIASIVVTDSVEDVRERAAGLAPTVTVLGIAASLAPALG